MNIPFSLNMFCNKNARVLNMSGLHKVLIMSEYAFEQCSNISEYV